MSLCVLFENLLQIHEPVCSVLPSQGSWSSSVSNDFRGFSIGICNLLRFRLRLVFNWIIYAFAGYLETEQVVAVFSVVVAFVLVVIQY